MKIKLIIVAIVVLAGLTWWLKPAPVAAIAQTTPVVGNGEMVAVTMPELDAQAARGQGFFQAVCAQCHGPNAGGLEGSGPPLIHKIYEPGHHGDFAIVRAARQGVQSHHWRFGNMPPVKGLTDGDLQDIIAFIRTVQRDNGIS